MDFLGIGLGELILILLIALIVFGPGKIVQVSRELGRIVHAFRKTSSELFTQVTKELESENKDQSPTPKEKKEQ